MGQLSCREALLWGSGTSAAAVGWQLHLQWKCKELTWLMGTDPSYSTGCTRSALHGNKEQKA